MGKLFLLTRFYSIHQYLQDQWSRLGYLLVSTNNLRGMISLNFHRKAWL